MTQSTGTGERSACGGISRRSWGGEGGEGTRELWVVVKAPVEVRWRPDIC